MIIYLPLDKFNINYIFFGESTKNTVIQNGTFIRVLYSTENIIMNGIYLYVPLTISNYNAYKCNIDILNPSTKYYINQIIIIEKNLLDKYNSNKNKIYKLAEQLQQNNIKLFNINNDIKNIILKISGLWEDETSIGITYKFINY
tara:strand:+ start:7565 stop:7996 length:432 start_codon:yes stop_codon:yes gene_type:complete